MQRKTHARFQQVLQDVKDRKLNAPARDEKPIDWASYTEAQINELKEYLTLTKQAVDEAATRLLGLLAQPGKPGRPAKSPIDKAKAILVQQYFQSSNRVTASLLWLVGDKVGIAEQLTYQDIERAYADPLVIAILSMVFDLSVEAIRDKERTLSVDGTGMPTSIKQNYEDDKTRKHAVYDMLVGMLGVETKLFTAYAVTNGNESPQFIPLLQESAQKLDRIELVCADAAYLSRRNCAAVAQVGAVPRIFPKRDIRIAGRGFRPWRKMLTEFMEHTEQWMREYRLRSISESANSVLKRVWNRPLLKRLDPRRWAEIGFRVVSYNLRRLGYLFHQGLPVRWLG